MTDARLVNGDLALDASGNVQTVSGADALFQRAAVRLGSRLGSFVYDRTLGSRHDYFAADPMAAQRLELLLNEGLTGLDNTFVTVTDVGESIEVTININGESRQTEVRLYGDV